LGLRYRKYAARLPGNPDVVFSKARVVVFCDGDFWHGRNWEELRTQLQRRHNADYWVAKIDQNRERDRLNTDALTGDGWLVLRLWETDITRDPGEAAEVVRQAVAARLAQRGSMAAKRPPA
jgi:DNA mismatch endonuclease (patch repair protein)